MSDPATVALLGLGTMGAGMARNLARAGLALRVWNRSPDRAGALAGDGIEAAATAAQAVDGAHVVITMLWDADSVADVMAQAAPKLAPGTVWIQTSTVGVEGARRLAEVAVQLGVVYVDAPVLGTKAPAEAGTLVVLASGPDEARERCAPVFDAIASRTLWVGAAGQGSRLKLVANAWVLTVVDGIAECLTLAGAFGLDPALFMEAIRGGAMDAPYVGMKGSAMLAGDFTPSFTVSGAAKDGALITRAGREVGADIPLLAQAAADLARTEAAGHGDLDLSATYLVHQPTSGGR